VTRRPTLSGIDAVHRTHRDPTDPRIAAPTLDTVLAAEDGDDAALQRLIDAGSWW
jgi:hypothetical protein